jgi:hypothetical protein
LFIGSLISLAMPLATPIFDDNRYITFHLHSANIFVMDFTQKYNFA